MQITQKQNSKTATPTRSGCWHFALKTTSGYFPPKNTITVCHNFMRTHEKRLSEIAFAQKFGQNIKLWEGLFPLTFKPWTLYILEIRQWMTIEFRALRLSNSFKGLTTLLVSKTQNPWFHIYPMIASKRLKVTFIVALGHQHALTSSTATEMLRPGRWE
jgi:hypothetical protein